MGINIVDILVKIPGFNTIYYFLRRKFYAKHPPLLYSQISIQNKLLLSSTPKITIDPDDHGLRLIAGGPLPVTSVRSRSDLEIDPVDYSHQVEHDILELSWLDSRFEIKFSQSEGWTKVEVSHSADHIFGLGEKHGDLDKQGKVWRFWNSDYASFEPDDDPLYKSHPVAILHDGQQWIAMIVDYPGFQYWDLTDDNKMDIHIQSESAILDFVFSTTPKQLMEKLSGILGTMPLPPEWSIGYHQCRWSYFPADQVREIAREFRERDIACDTIYLDIDYMDGFRCFTYDAEGFGDLPKLVDYLHDEDFKVIAMIDPAIKYEHGYEIFDSGIDEDVYVKSSDGSNYTGSVWAGKSVFPDFFNITTREWWGSLYKQFIVDFRIDGIWNDMNEPSVFNLRGTMPDDVLHKVDEGTTVLHESVHNLYGQKMVEASYEGIQQWQLGKRVFLLSRSAYLGSQQYGWIWSGDNRADWSHLRLSIPKLLNSGLVGHFANGPDIGGFREKPSPELYARWIQLGVFYPFMRTHTMKFVDEQEPWSFGKEVEDIAREMIRLRYRLLPYIYTYFQEGCKKGIPLMRPMWMEFPEDSKCYDSDIINTQFMFGPDILVAPVLEQGHREVEFYLPEGSWYQFFSKEVFTGGQKYTITADLGEINIFVREGSIIPVYKNVHRNVEKTKQSGIEYLKFGEDASGRIYRDDGATLDYLHGAYTIHTIDSELNLELEDGDGYQDNTAST